MARQGGCAESECNQGDGAVQEQKLGARLRMDSAKVTFGL